MSDCCKNDLGDVAHNGSVATGVNATQAGTHIATLFLFGTRLRRSFFVNLGDEIIVQSPFNEDYQYLIQIEQPDGSNITKNDCENFTFKTYIETSEMCAPCVECEEIDVEYF